MILIICQSLILFFFITKSDFKKNSGFPLDDAWIHQSIARNLGEHFELSFNQGELTTGSTSLLWTFILSLNFLLFNLDPVYYTLIINILLYFSVSIFLYKLFKEEIDESTSLAIVLLFIITGNVLFFAFSGMEVFLFYFLSIASIYFFVEKKYLVTGVFCGFLILTRPEGLGLFLIMILYILFNKIDKKAMLYLIISSIVFLGISFFINLSISGGFLPNTFMGRRWLYELSGKPFDFNPEQAWSFLCSWYFRIKKYTFGINETGSLIKNLLKNGVNYVLFLFIALGSLRILKNGLWNAKENKRKAIFLLFIWSVVLNFLYIIFLPALGHAGRYQPFNYLLVPMTLVLGVKFILQWLFKESWFKTTAISLAGIILLFIFLNNALFWAKVTKMSIFHINNTHKKMALYLKANIPENEKIAAFDIGAIKFFSNQNIVDVGGLIDSKFIPYLFSGNTVSYLKNKGVKYIILPFLFSGKTEIGWRLGIFKEKNKVSLIKLKEFGTSIEIWKSGINALYHADPKQVLFKIMYP